MVVPIETDCPRGHSAFSSFNSSRGTSANSTAYSMDYADCIQAQANNLTWAEQVENGEVQSPSLSYTSLKDVILDYKETGSSKLILFCIFLANLYSMVLSTSALICSSDFSCSRPLHVRVANLELNIFFYFIFISLFFLLLLLVLSCLTDDEEACDCSHMTYHMR